MQRHINKEMSTVSVVFPLLCPTPVRARNEIRSGGGISFHASKIRLQECVYNVGPITPPPGRAIAPVVSRPIPNKVVRICGTQNGTGVGFLRHF